MNALVVIVRGLPCGFLGAYGNDWVGTPTLDQLAAQGVVFDQHFADSPDETGARRAWQTGRYHLPTADGTSDPQSPSETNLFDVLKTGKVALHSIVDADFEHGVAAARTAIKKAKRGSTVVWLESSVLLPPWEFPDEVFDSGSGDEMGDDPEAAAPESPLDPLPDPATGPLGDDPTDRTFRRLQETFAAAVRYLDTGLADLLEAVPDDWLVLVTSDHGMALGEHGIVGPHRPWLHEELVHLSLIVRMPAGTGAGGRVRALTQPIDLLPTLLDLFGITVPADLHGHSLAPLLRGGDATLRDYACIGLQIGLALEWAVRTDDWSYLLPLQGEFEDAARPPRLHAKPEDRWEVNDVRQHHLELAEHLEQLLHDFVKATQRPGPLVAPVLRDVEAELAPEPTQP